jgi:short-subunit dehydrogenase involved in D-alanine esterification of teichoic acids
LDGKVALITGAGTGIGRGTIRRTNSASSTMIWPISACALQTSSRHSARSPIADRRSLARPMKNSPLAKR